MTDNLLQLIDLQPGLLLADLIDKTKRCAITWDQVSHTSFHSTFIWKNDWYDVYVTLMRGSYGLDLNRNERNVLSINSYVNDQVAVLYYVITDSVDDNEIKQIIQDVNSLISERNIKREAALGGVKVGGTSTVLYTKHVVGGVKTGGTASLVAAPASFTNDATAEYDGYSYSNFDETNPTLVIGSANNHIPFYYGQGLFDKNDPTNKRGANFALIPYVRFDNYSGQFIGPFTPKTATYSIVNEVVQPNVIQPSTDNFNLLGGQPNSETVMLINIGSPNGVGYYYKLFLNLIFKTSNSSVLSIRAFMGYTNCTSPTYMPSSTSDLPITVTDAVAEIDLGGDTDILAAVEISEVIGEVISQPGWLTTNGIMLQVRASLAEDTYSLPYNSLANGSGVYGSPDIIELSPINFTSRFNSYIRFTMNQAGIADICTLSVVKDEEFDGDSALVVKAVKDVNIAWPTSAADLDDYVLTDASATYSVAMADEIGTKYDIEVTSIVQEIIDQDGWVAGNAIMFVLTDGHQFRTYHVQQIISEVSMPVRLAAQENVDYDNATLTFQPRSVSIGGMKTGGSAIIGEGAVLYMANPDSTGSLEVLSVSGNVRTILTGLTNIAGVRVDQEYGKIFWSQVEVNEFESPKGTSIFTCGTDGSGATEIVSLPTYDGIRGFDLDRVNRKIYLVVDRNWDLGTTLLYYVMRCDYDGSNLQDVHNGTNTDICSPTSLSVDVENGYVFWCDSYGLDKGYVHRCDLDGSNYVTLLSTTGYVRVVCAHQSELYLGGSGLLAKVNEQGSNEILLPHTGLSVIDSIDINDSGVMYISDLGVNKVVSTDLDGNNMTVLVNDSSSRSAICVASGVIVLDEHETGSGGATMGGTVSLVAAHKSFSPLYMARVEYGPYAPMTGSPILGTYIDRLNSNSTTTRILSDVGLINDLAADTDYGKIFWVGRSTISSNSFVYSCNLDGTLKTKVVDAQPATFSHLGACMPQCIVLDKTNHYIYYAMSNRTYYGNSEIRRCNYDGSSDVSITLFANMPVRKIDLSSGVIYYIGQSQVSYYSDNVAGKCDANGSNPQIILTKDQFLRPSDANFFPRAILVHSGRVYLSDANGRVVNMDTDGNDHQTSFDFDTNTKDIDDILIDENDVMHVAAGGYASRTNMDGTYYEELTAYVPSTGAIDFAGSRMGVPTAITSGSGTLTIPSNYDKIFIEIWGCGGGGGGGGTTGHFHAGGGGGAGGYTSNLFVVTPGQQFHYSIVYQGATTVTTGAYTMIANAGQNGQNGEDVISGNATGGAGGTFVNGDGHNGQDGFDSSGNAGGSGGSVYVGFNGAVSGYGSGTGAIGTWSAGSGGMAPGGGGAGTGNGQGAGGLPTTGWISFTPYYND